MPNLRDQKESLNKFSNIIKIKEIKKDKFHFVYSFKEIPLAVHVECNDNVATEMMHATCLGWM